MTREASPVLVTDRLEVFRSALRLSGRRATLLVAVERVEGQMVFPCAYATLVHESAVPVLFHIEVIACARRRGLGMAMLEAVTELFRETDATWSTDTGQCLADAYQRRRGAVDRWVYLLPPWPDPASGSSINEIVDAVERASAAPPTLVTYRELEAIRKSPSRSEAAELEQQAGAVSEATTSTEAPSAPGGSAS